MPLPVEQRSRNPRDTCHAPRPEARNRVTRPRNSSTSRRIARTRTPQTLRLLLHRMHQAALKRVDTFRPRLAQAAKHLTSVLGHIGSEAHVHYS